MCPLISMGSPRLHGLTLLIKFIIVFVICQKSISIRTVEIVTSYGFLIFFACKCERLINGLVTRYVIIILFLLHLDNFCNMSLVADEIVMYSQL